MNRSAGHQSSKSSEVSSFNSMEISRTTLSAFSYLARVAGIVEDAPARAEWDQVRVLSSAESEGSSQPTAILSRRWIGATLVAAVVGLVACGDSVQVTGRLVAVDGIDLAGAQLESSVGSLSGEDLAGSTLGADGRFDIEVPGDRANEAVGFRIRFPDGGGVAGQIYLSGEDVDLGELPVWAPDLAVERMDGASQATWELPEELPVAVDSSLVVDGPDYRLGMLDVDDQRSATVGDWVIEDYDAVASLLFVYSIPATTYFTVGMYSTAVALAPSDVRSLAADLPCYVQQSGISVPIKEEPCSFSSQEPGYPWPFCDSYGDSDCVDSVEFDLGEVKQVRRIALRNVQVPWNIEHPDLEYGSVPQFAIDGALPADSRPTPTHTAPFEPLGFVAAPFGFYLLELPEAVPMRYVRIRGLGQMVHQGRIGVFE